VGTLGVLLRPRRATPLEVSVPGKLGLPEILLILAVALLIFGPSKLADLGKGLGEGIKNFKSSIKEGEEPGEKKP
jgi:sec-independent protein translocase protein TatA